MKFARFFCNFTPEIGKKYMAAINDLVRQIENPELRQRIQQEVAQYATENSVINRAQLIRMIGEKLVRLDFARHSELREKVGIINSNEELENLFTQYEE